MSHTTVHNIIKQLMIRKMINLPLTKVLKKDRKKLNLVQITALIVNLKIVLLKVKQEHLKEVVLDLVLLNNRFNRR